MVRGNHHDKPNLTGAICPARTVDAAVITPAANTECMDLHLAGISKQVAPGALAASSCDEAGWRQSGGNLRLRATSCRFTSQLCTRIEPDGERLGISARQQTFHRSLEQLRNHTRRLL